MVLCNALEVYRKMEPKPSHVIVLSHILPQQSGREGHLAREMVPILRSFIFLILSQHTFLTGHPINPGKRMITLKSLMDKIRLSSFLIHPHAYCYQRQKKSTILAIKRLAQRTEIHLGKEFREILLFSPEESLRIRTWGARVIF